MTPTLIDTVPGTPVGIDMGQLSTGGNYVGFKDVAVAYRAATTFVKPNESMVAIFQNAAGTLTRRTVPGVGGDYDAGDTFPTAIKLGFLTNATATPWEDIVVTSNENGLGRGTISVLRPAALPTGIVSPGISTFNIPVQVPNPASAVNNLTVTLDLVDQQSVQNLQIVLIAPNNAGRFTLVNNQINAAGTASTGVGLPSGNAIGVFGFSAGPTGTFGTSVGTVFDDNALRGIFDPNTTGTNGNSTAGASAYIGYFRPEGGSLASFLGSIGSANINGTWQLQITNFSAATTPGSGGSLRKVSLQFSSGLTKGVTSTIATTPVTGALGNVYALKPPAASSVGVGPGLVLAADNTLGPNSPHPGRIYAAFVDYFKNTDPNTHVNPTTNTDIVLGFLDPGSTSWTLESIVNDDNAITDGFSGSGGVGTFAYTSGRTQFQPEIAVDQTTGTLVLSWRDARDDAANARVATYIATSLDGGETFSPETYANPQNTATDAITGQTVNLGPMADNQSSGNPQTDAAFGFGNQMGLAVSSGHIIPIWAGNLNQSFVSNGTVFADPLNILVQPMAIAAGPRILNSTMGPIPLAEAASGVVSISVTFDRAIIPSTFGNGNVKVFYHDTNKADGYVALQVINVVPVPGSGNTQFTITFNPLPSGADPATFNFTGTYSYVIQPDTGPGSTPIQRACLVVRRRRAPEVRPDRPERRRGLRPESARDAHNRPDSGRRLRRSDAQPAARYDADDLLRYYEYSPARFRFESEHAAADRSRPASLEHVSPRR